MRRVVDLPRPPPCNSSADKEIRITRRTDPEPMHIGTALASRTISNASDREAKLKFVATEHTRVAQPADVRAASRAILVIGLCLTVATLANLVLVWTEARFGTAQWELAASTQTFERIPMLLLSLLLVGVAGVGAQSLGITRAAAVGFWLVALIVGALDVIYALGTLQAYHAMPALVQGAFKASAIKNIVTTGLFVISAVYVGLLLWGRRSRTRAASQSD
jgi:hypothetical protein